MKLSELRNLDPQKIGSWPIAIRGLVILVLCAAVLGAGYYFDTQHQIASLKRVEAKEGDLKETFETKQRKFANLEPLKLQLAEMEQSFGAMLRLLPDETEIEGLLVDISQSGLASGLEFELFKPEKEIPAEFYAIKPIKITVLGAYHEFGQFVSAVAALPRIVTQHDIAISPREQKGDQKAALAMNITAKTYRYLKEEEIQQIEEASKPKSKKKRKRKKSK